ncbi:hypothetical protein [Comamonas kerstersii]|uniref:hypothetical protein n=1 Tax=Comamonas kerstersii TaxID=225992 RepID=UPI001B3422C3|nr:hypothetical protein [Comamonas kerstersii]QTW17821.1 hypothetical protein H8N02_11265 [Comamonas kerstersii]
MIETQSIDTAVNEILKEWHVWSAAEGWGKGYGSRSASCNDGTDSTTEWEIADMQTVDAVIDAIPQPHRTAIAFIARNLATRAQVWTSPRLPKDRAELQVLNLEARNMLTRSLIERGVL